MINNIYIAIVISLFTVSVSAEEVLTIEKCRDMAVEHNHQLKKARLQKEESLENIKTARTAALPSLSADASWTYMMNLDDISMPGSFLKTATSEEAANRGEFTGTSDIWMPGLEFQLGNISFLTANLTVSQSVYAGGKIKYMNKQADEGAKIASLAYNLTYSDVIEQTDRAYWNLVAIDAQVDLAKTYIEMLTELEKQMSDMHEVGLVPASEKLKVSVQKNEAELNLLRAKNALKVSEMYLNQIIGRDLNMKVFVNDQLKYSVPSFNAGVSVSDAAEGRDELKVLDRQLKISEYDKKIIQSDHLPQLGVGASYYTFFTNKLEDDGDFQPTVSAQLSIPLFNWGQSKSKRNAARLRIHQLETERRNTEELINLEIQQAKIKVEEAVETILIAKRNTEEAKENLNETKNSFEVGLNTTTEMLDAQAYWQSAHTQMIRALVEFEIAQTGWNKAIGNITP